MKQHASYQVLLAISTYSAIFFPARKMAILEVFPLTTFIPSDEFVGMGPLWGALTCWCLPLRVLMPKLCSWEHQEGTGGTKFNFASTLQLVLCFGCVSFGKIFWDHCALLNLALQHRKDSILKVQSLLSRPFLHILFGGCATMHHEKPVRYKRSDTPAQMKSLEGRHLKRTVVFWPPFCMPDRDVSTEWKSSLRPCKDWKQMQAKHQKNWSLFVSHYWVTTHLWW